MGSKSVSTNEREEALFKPEVFRGLEKGHFIGFTSDCNEPIFKGLILPPKVEPKEVPDISAVTEEVLINNFKRIINSTKRTFTKM